MRSALSLCAVLLFASVALSQTPPVCASGPCQRAQFYSSGNLQYVCLALATQPVSSPPVQIASAMNASPVVFTVTGGHGLNSDTTPLLRLGGLGGNWAAANGIWTATVLSTTTFSIPVDSTSFGSLTGQPYFTTRAPLLTSPIWAIQNYAYDTSNNLTTIAWAAGTWTADKVCASRTSYFFQ
jgi:hypothetical protein